MGPLLRALPPASLFTEPCAGDGALIGALEAAGHICVDAYDIDPRGPDICVADALDITSEGLLITNPPFARPLLEPLLAHWTGRCDIWLLLPLDMLCNLWCAPYMQHVGHLAPIGRVSWLSNGTGGFENYAWFRFNLRPQPFIQKRLKA